MYKGERDLWREFSYVQTGAKKSVTFLCGHHRRDTNMYRTTGRNARWTRYE
jgi:hypothetical protein